jgi:protein subunit release factor A
MKLKEIRVEFLKSPGPGGQHKNKRFTAVRVTHLPTGLVSFCGDSRSQAQNKEVAFQRLRQKLAEKFRIRKPRVATKVPKSVKEKVLDWKKHRGVKKRLRSKRVEDFEW